MSIRLRSSFFSRSGFSRSQAVAYHCSCSADSGTLRVLSAMRVTRGRLSTSAAAVTVHLMRRSLRFLVPGAVTPRPLGPPGHCVIEPAAPDLLVPAVAGLVEIPHRLAREEIIVV